MKINFSKKQYDTLLEMIQLGYFITSSNEETGNESKYYRNGTVSDVICKGF